MAPKIPVEQRIWSRVDKTTSCWIWTGGTSGGRGMVWLDGRNHPAYRVIYELLKGSIPEGLALDHLCRNPICVNPDHLEPVTYGENVRRSPDTPTGINSRKTHCPQGHEYDYTYKTKWGTGRGCKKCWKEASRRFLERQHAKGLSRRGRPL